MQIEKIFNNGNPKDGRIILIKINHEYIEFFYKEYYDAKRIWIEEEEQRRNEFGEDPLNKDEISNDPFYWTWVEDWKIPERNWEKHMIEKAWFSEKMLDFINTALCTQTK